MTAWVNAKFEVWSNHNGPATLVGTYTEKEAAAASKVNNAPKDES